MVLLFRVTREKTASIPNRRGSLSRATFSPSSTNKHCLNNEMQGEDTVDMSRGVSDHGPASSPRQDWSGDPQFCGWVEVGGRKDAKEGSEVPRPCLGVCRGKGESGHGSPRGQ